MLCSDCPECSGLFFRVAGSCLDEAAGAAGFSLCVEEVEAVWSLAGSQGDDCSLALELPASVT